MLINPGLFPDLGPLSLLCVLYSRKLGDLFYLIRSRIQLLTAGSGIILLEFSDLLCDPVELLDLSVS
jgi:hypothetical protein